MTSTPKPTDQRGGLLPLTAAQRGMWFAENMSPDYSVNVAQYLDIRDTDRTLDTDLMVRLHDESAHELESAFTRIVFVDGTPMQTVDHDLGFTLELVDMRDEADPVAAATAWMNDDYRSPVELVSDRPLARAALLRVADDRVFWYMRAHHVLMDGFSALNSVLRQFERYNATVAGEDFAVKPHADLAELVADDIAYATGPRRERDREYWAECAVDLPERVTLAQHASTAALSPVNLVAGRTIDPSLQARLTDLAAESSSSIAVLLTAGFSAYLSRMTGTDEVVLSVPVTGRATAKIKRASGMVSNMLPVRATGAADLTFDELIAQIQLELTGVLRHQRYRFEDIRQDAGMRDAATASFGPIVNIVFFDKPLALTGADVGYHILSSGILEDLRINFYQESPTSPVSVDLHGNPNLYSEDELAVHLDRFLEFLTSTASTPNERIGDVPLLTVGDAESVDRWRSGADADYSSAGRHLLDGFDRQVAARPDAAVLVTDDERLTYAELDEARRRLAARLIDDGVLPGDRVIVALDRGIDQVVAIYAVLTAGGAYVPVDPSHPQDRRDLVTRTAQARVVIDAAYLSATAGGAPADTVPVPADAPAYAIFTSGSTGTPKGVQVSHAAVVNRLAWTQDHYPLSTGDVVLYKTPFTFDVSVWELFWPPAVGATTVIARPDGHRDPEYLHRVMADAGVSVAHFVPSMLDVFLDDRGSRPGERTFAPGVRRIFTSGEALTGKTADRALASDGVDVVNLYGPTEAAVDVTEHRVARGETLPPIGSPVPNTRVHVLDDRLRPVPKGVPGELYLAGVQLAHGYLGRTALTSERFVAEVGATDPGARMYRTGDLVRWSSNGELEYLGRTDFQVKIRGQRVELGEVESVLTDRAGVDGAVAMVRDDVAATPTLVAYVKSVGTSIDEPELLAWCRRRLPSHMVPTAIVVLDDFPLNSSGKTDRRALPAPVLRTAEYEAPRTETEVELAGIIAELLGVDRVGRRDNLFALGGNSLVAARLVTRARDGLGVDLRLTDVFEATDLAELAAGGVHADHDDASPLVHVSPRPERIPLSTAQSRLWLVNRIDPTSSTYNMPGAVRLGTQIDVDAFAASVHDVVRRHEILRTRFVTTEDGQPVQMVCSIDETGDALNLEPILTDDAATAVRVIAGEGFDLTAQTPFRARLIRDDDGYVLVVVLHHIAADGYSLVPLIADLGAAYDARCAGRAPELDDDGLQYADYALWQADHLSRGTTVDDDLLFWRSELAGLPELLPLPTSRPRPAVATGRGGYLDLVADPMVTGRIRDLAKAAGVTTFTVVHAAVALVLSRCSGTGDIAIGVAVDGRRDDRLARLVGMFVDTVVLRTEVSERESLHEFLAGAHRTRARAMGHATVPFERVVEELAPSRSAAHTPLFQVGLTMLGDTTSEMSEGPLGFELIDARVPAAKYDVSVSVVEKKDRLDFELSYATDLFDAPTVSWFGRALLRVLDRFAAVDLDAAIGTIDVVGPRTLAALTAAPATAAPAVVLGDLWDRHGATSPGSVRDADTVRTRDEFDAEANRLARALLARGAGPGDVVAVGTGRGADAVLATVAVSKTGAAFVSVDPALPAERRAEILGDSGAILAIGTDTLPGVEWIAVDGAETSACSDAPIEPSELRRRPQIDDIAYLIYTSGSTGKPKAAAVSHRGIANMVANQRDVLGLGESSTVLQVAAPSFDASVFEITMALCTGASLVVSPPEVFAGPALADVIAGHGVTHAVMTPSVLAGLDPADMPELRTVISVGEACPPELVRRWAQADRAFFNLYGPTESTIWATATGPLRAGDEVTIGEPVRGVGAMVLGGSLRPAPVGVPGELYLTGEQLAQGYLGRPELTAARFVADPFGPPGARMYRTGDRVTLLPGGGLRYLGRTDFQLKLRGMRIEPGEVDGALTTHPDVGAALTVGMPGPTGETVLVSYVTGRGGVSVDPVDVRAHMIDLLPSHLVPHTVVPVDEFETTVVGKIDRSSLPPVDFEAGREFVAPRSETERVVAEVFATELGVDRIGVTDDFFEVGGTSLSAVAVTTRLAAVRGARIALRDMFENPSAAQLAVVLDQAATDVVEPLRPRLSDGPVPVSGAQRTMWLVNRNDPDSAAYNIAMALRLDGDLNVDAMRAAFGDVVERHEALRTVYPMVDGDPVQSVRGALQARADADLDVGEVTGSLPDAIGAITGRGFDLVNELPIRAALLRTGPSSHVLVLSIHHISADGSSMAPLATDMMTAYADRSSGRAPSWKPLPIQYADFADWRARRLSAQDADGRSLRQRQLDYWESQLADAPALELPTDRSRPTTPTFAGDAVDFAIDAGLVRRLGAIGRARGASLFMVAHAAYAIMLARSAGRHEVVVGTPYAGRDAAVLEPVVGMFVNTLALRTAVDPADGFGEVVDRVRADDLTAMSNADVAFDEIVDRLGVGGTRGANAVYQAMFVFQNLAFPRVELAGLTVSPEDEQLTAAKVDVQLTLFPNDPTSPSAVGDVRGQLIFATDLFDRSTAEAMVDRYLRILSAVADDPDIAVGDIVLQEQALPSDAGADDTPRNLADLVADAAASIGDAVAIEHSGVTLTFSSIMETVAALEAAMPGTDRDSLLTMTVMSSVPGLAEAGPETLDVVLQMLRSNAEPASQNAH